MSKSKLKTCWALLVIFFKAGTFTFAGGLAMLPVIEKDVVEKYRLMSKDDFLEYATLAQTLPGVIALNCASFVGRHSAGTLGMLAASFGATISAFVIMLAATMAIQFIPKTGPVVGAMRCIRAASAAFILSAAFSLGRHNLKSAFAVIVMLAAFISAFFLNISTPLVVLFAGIAGYGYQRIVTKRDASNPASLKNRGAHDEEEVAGEEDANNVENANVQQEKASVVEDVVAGALKKDLNRNVASHDDLEIDKENVICGESADVDLKSKKRADENKGSKEGGQTR